MINPFVLFSPIGHTDPVRNDYDGPLLHILRHYRPREVYLALTVEMAELENADHRYAMYGKRVLPEATFRSIELDIRDASDFEQFFPVYERLLDKIAKEHPDDRILVNMTSGTPQGMATLCAYLCSRETGRFIPIQVKSPAGKGNVSIEHFSGDQPIEAVFANLLDDNRELYQARYGGESAPNRCRELRLRNYTKSYIKAKIMESIRKGDYAHCSALAEDGTGFLSRSFIHAAAGADLRHKFRLTQAKDRFAAAGLASLIPSASYTETLEFYLGLRHTFNIGDHTAFYARISPLASAMSLEALEQYFGLPIRRYINLVGNEERLQTGALRRDMAAMVSYAEKTLHKLRDDYPKLAMLNCFMKYLYMQSGDPIQAEILQEFEWLRSQEKALRNRIDHNMHALSALDVLQAAGVQKPEDVINRIDRLFVRIFSADPRTGFLQEMLNAYTQMNEAILRLLEDDQESAVQAP